MVQTQHHIFNGHNQYQELVAKLKKPPLGIHITGLLGSSISFLVNGVFSESKKAQLLIADDKEEAAYLLNDLEALLSKEKVLFYPESYKRAYDSEETDNANVLMRTEVLNALQQNHQVIIVTYPAALCEKVISRSSIQDKKMSIRKGDALDYDFILDMLIEYEFDRDDFVYEPGQFAARGGIIDIFSFASELPFRIELSGDTVDSIRSFNPDNQLSIAQFDIIDILPNVENKMLEEDRISFLEFLPKNTVLWINSTDKTSHIIKEYYTKAEAAYIELSGEVNRSSPDKLFLSPELFSSQINTFHRFIWGTQQDHSPDIIFNTTQQPPFQKNFELLYEKLIDLRNQDYQVQIFSDQQKQIDRISNILEEIHANKSSSQEQFNFFKPVHFSIYSGFIDHASKTACFTDHQIFERYKRFKLKANFSKEQALTIKELTNLNPGDYITHIDHGIGQFGGLETVINDGKKQESVRLIFKDGDTVFVSIHALHKISRYSGKDGKKPTLNKIGTKTWQTIKAKTKKKVKELAFDLIKLYAKRKAEKGFAFSHDSYLQNELEASFIYEDTPDQYKATQDVKADMEKPHPMDRLICGDVGFGKTEVAIRAAFKAACDGKQVAILVPTTVLALQHFKTFSSRLREFPVTIDYLNRFRSTKQIKSIEERLKNGQLDIVIGTHKLVGQKVQFKDLGLLIIDEEQKFGVGTKDKIKTLKASVDTLTLTATPIPRTLQFSLMGARDLSIIRTPPPNRYPVVTELRGYNEETIRDAISYELSRDGQVFFIHNRVQNLPEIAGIVSRLCPQAKVKFAHGQMEGQKLEEIMLEFIDGDVDVLVSTSIVENGLDIPNANTIIINEAQNFGLSDLHQMRGRVGRSNKKAFCYLLSPPLITLTNEARRRLNALLEFSDLGSGFNIAMKDLDIRGAGNILGAEQSGYINDIGFETYQRILADAIQELKENEFKELFKEELEKEDHKWVGDCNIDTDLEILIPESYVDNITERLALYKDIDNLKTEEEIQKFRNELEDRFGKIPIQTEELFDTVRLRLKAETLGMEKIILKRNTMICLFISDENSPFYQSDVFSRILNFLQNPASTQYQFKQQVGKLVLQISNTKNIHTALKRLTELGEYQVTLSN